jgi:hypothetical protein
MTLDHWSYGPHHVWVVPETGSIIRMWQPCARRDRTDDTGLATLLHQPRRCPRMLGRGHSAVSTLADAQSLVCRRLHRYNGLQIFPNGTLPSDVDPALFNVPPPECTSAYHFTFKIHCNASGCARAATASTLHQEHQATGTIACAAAAPVAK